MAKATTTFRSIEKKTKKKIFRHAKKKQTFSKTSKNYFKQYKGQGR